MTIELRVLSGSRAGARQSFDKSIVTVGRHAMSDLKFDPQGDLDVSTRHAEFRESNGAWTVSDEGSTNGTLVNGERITGTHRLSDGDVVSFGANGPRVEVRGVGAAAAPVTQLSPAASVAPSAPPKPVANTEVRVAHAVKAQTRGMKRMFGAALGAVVAIGAGGFVYLQSQASKREAQWTTMIAQSEGTIAALQKNLAAMRPADSITAVKLQEEIEARKGELASARELIKSGAAQAPTEELSKRLAQPAGFGQIDLRAITERNDAAVAMIAADFGEQVIAGTAFGITKGGLLVTNRHVVRNEAGPAVRLAVIFANTKQWRKAHIVRVADGEDDDLALIQLDDPGDYPTVSSVSRTGDAARVGAPVASIGYPLATDLPMDGSGLKVTAATTLNPGTVSKRLESVIQIDSYAGHGSSGSPLFDANGSVVGVIYGGAKESNGKIVYAVPAQRLAAFLGADGASILK